VGGWGGEEKKRIPTKFSIDLMASCRVSPFLKPDVKSSIGITLPPNRTICIEIYHCSLNFCNFFFLCVCVCVLISVLFGTFWYFFAIYWKFFFGTLFGNLFSNLFGNLFGNQSFWKSFWKSLEIFLVIFLVLFFGNYWFFIFIFHPKKVTSAFLSFSFLVFSLVLPEWKEEQVQVDGSKNMFASTLPLSKSDRLHHFFHIFFGIQKSFVWESLFNCFGEIKSRKQNKIK